ncbi:MAG: 50S ribosomal protein L24 [Chloroflexi bacterium]|nr:50S ribosomal protein L24 [Chloroflexota bacterium]
MKIHRNDDVLVTTGKDKGKKGKVHAVDLQKERVLVEGVNLIKRHTKPRGKVRQAGIVEKEAPLHVSKVMLLCTKCGKPTRVGFRFLESGAKARFCRVCNELID